MTTSCFSNHSCPCSGNMSREQILHDYREKLSRALQGTEVSHDVCGLGIEALRYSIQDERDQLLREHGHIDSPDAQAPVSPSAASTGRPTPPSVPE